MAKSSEFGSVLTVEGAFTSYLAMLFGETQIPPIQRQELQKAFYGAIFWLIEVQLTFVTLMSDEEGAALMQKIREEVLAFATNLPDNGPGGVTEEPVHT